MTTSNDHNGPAAQGNAPDALEELFRHVSARERPPREDEHAIRQSVHDEWRRVTGASWRRRTGIAMAVAASALLAVALLVLRPGAPVPGKPGPLVAAVEKVTGAATQTAGDGSVWPLGAGGDSLIAGSRLSTAAASGLALRWTNGAVIRVDEATDLLLESGNGIRLLRGAVYVDTGEAQATGDTPAIITPQGRIRHLGTRYMTRLSPAGTAVSVRAGAVIFSKLDRVGKETLRATAGQRLVVAISGEPRFEDVPTWGEEWAWAEGLSTRFAADGRPLNALFEWVASETGRALAYASPEARQLASSSVLHGAFDLAPLEALSVASATSDLVAEVRGGEIFVRWREP
jgi:ferric-dicitrate binding protein FerR (iron transport regulator)